MEIESVLPDELLVNIFGYLNSTELAEVSLVCRQWLRISKTPELWRRLVLYKWPSQRFLYGKVSSGNLQWKKVFKELHQKSWFSPDDMKYFINCKTVEDELASPELREAMFLQMAKVSQKWLQVYPYEHDEADVRSFDKNAELYYDTTQLKWVFLDRRRLYMRDLFPSHKITKIQRKNKKVRHVRNYQVISSCIVLYRWLCLFRSYATAEDGLTFYRIWRFRLKHAATGMIFEIFDWKAAMNSTFSNGMPNNVEYRDDALELLDLLSHPHFIMHPLGLQTTAEKYLACATAGGMPRPRLHRERTSQRKRKMRALSPKISTAGISEQDKTKPASEFYDNEEENVTERRGVRRILSPSVISLPTLRNNSAPVFAYGKQSFSRQSSTGSILSDTEESERSERESDVESECDAMDTGYVSNCEYFIVTTKSFDIEEQHSIQASVSDGWMVTRKSLSSNIPVFYNSNSSCWNFSSDASFGHYSQSYSNANFQAASNHSRSDSDISMHSELSTEVSDDNLPLKQSFMLGSASKLTNVGKNKAFAASGDLLSPPVSPLFFPVRKEQSSDPFPFIGNSKQNKICSEFGDSSHLIHSLESIPSCLALYRLICLFDLNCSMYTSEDDSSVWSVKMLHKKTGGIVQFQDYNGWFKVGISTDMSQSQHQQDGDSDDELPDDGATATTASSSGARADATFDSADFKAAVIQVLDLLMDDKFSHPYGTVAGSVA